MHTPLLDVLVVIRNQFLTHTFCFKFVLIFFSVVVFFHLLFRRYPLTVAAAPFPPCLIAGGSAGTLHVPVFHFAHRIHTNSCVKTIYFFFLVAVKLQMEYNNGVKHESFSFRYEKTTCARSLCRK